MSSRKDLFGQIESFDRSSLRATPRRRTERAYKELGVVNPQPNNMMRNIRLSQLETFHTFHSLKPRQDEQRYMVSPHSDVRNFLNNARGLGQQAMRDNHPGIRPVFKDEKQRKAFHKMASEKLSDMGDYKSLKNDNSRFNHQAYSKLVEWSSPENAMMSFAKLNKKRNKKRSHPIVFVQGHGSPGIKSISSDSNEHVSSKDVANMLHKMQLPNVSEVRANSCHSGTEHVLHDLPEPREKFQKNEVEQHAGVWDKTFAGSLESELNKLSENRHNRVRGYMGPSSQGYVAVTAKTPLGGLTTQSHTGVRIGSTRFKHGQLSRTSSSTHGLKD